MILLTGHTLAASQPKTVIYGEDNRHDLKDEIDTELLEFAKSSAVLVKRRLIQPVPGRDDLKRFFTKSLEQKYKLCPGETFAKQPAPGHCSGFLIAPDLFVTAGHCIATSSICENTAIVFDFSLTRNSELNPRQDRDLKVIKKSNIYHCREIVAQELSRKDLNDFAIIRLDRKVTDRQPLNYRTEGEISLNDRVIAIGNPLGLPTKITDEGTIRDVNPDKYFVVAIDSFQGSSGSPLINSSTGLVEGILVRGESDLIKHPIENCSVVKVCAEDLCRGEDATRTHEFAKYLKAPRLMSGIIANSGTVNIPIPDAYPVGLNFPFKIDQEEVITSTSIYFEMKHSFFEDIQLSVTHPDGTTVMLRSRDGAPEEVLKIQYGGDAGIPAPALDAFKGKSSKGKWVINVADLSSSDTGTLIKMILKINVQK